MKLKIVAARASPMRERSQSVKCPTIMPTTSAPTTDHTSDWVMLSRLTEPATAPNALRNSTSAEASLIRPSPSKIVTIRRCTPWLLTIVVATASVGLITAPIAIPIGSPRPGMMALRTKPSATVEAITSKKASEVIALRLRRKSCTGVLTAVANSSGGKITSIIKSGSTSNPANCGRKLKAPPTTNKMTGVARRSFSLKGSDNAMIARALSAMMRVCVIVIASHTSTDSLSFAVA